MDDIAKRKLLLIVVLFGVITLSNIPATLAVPPMGSFILLTPDETGANDDGVKPGKTNILGVYHANDGTTLWFRVNFETAYGAIDLHIYLDCSWETTGDGGHRNTQYCLDAGDTSLTSGTLYYYDGTNWDTIAGTVTISSYNTTAVDLSIPLSAINYDQGGSGDTVDIYAASDVSTNVAASQTEANFNDLIPNTGTYQQGWEVIPEFPFPTLYIFVPVLLLSAYALWRRRLGSANDRPVRSPVDLCDHARVQRGAAHRELLQQGREHARAAR